MVILAVLQSGELSNIGLGLGFHGDIPTYRTWMMFGLRRDERERRETRFISTDRWKDTCSVLIIQFWGVTWSINTHLRIALVYDESRRESIWLYGSLEYVLARILGHGVDDCTSYNSTEVVTCEGMATCIDMESWTDVLVHSRVLYCMPRIRLLTSVGCQERVVLEPSW
jgi:hypothetical protein